MWVKPFTNESGDRASRREGRDLQISLVVFKPAVSGRRNFVPWLTIGCLVGLTVRQTAGLRILWQGLQQDPFYMAYTAFLRALYTVEHLASPRCDWSRFWVSTAWCDARAAPGTK